MLKVCAVRVLVEFVPVALILVALLLEGLIVMVPALAERVLLPPPLAVIEPLAVMLELAPLSVSVLVPALLADISPPAVAVASEPSSVMVFVPLSALMLAVVVRLPPLVAVRVLVPAFAEIEPTVMAKVLALSLLVDPAPSARI